MEIKDSEKKLLTIRLPMVHPTIHDSSTSISANLHHLRLGPLAAPDGADGLALSEVVHLATDCEGEVFPSNVEALMHP